MHKLVLIALALVITTPAHAKGGHGTGIGFAPIRSPQGGKASFGFALPPARVSGGGHHGEAPFALPAYGSPNVRNFPGREP